MKRIVVASIVLLISAAACTRESADARQAVHADTGAAVELPALALGNYTGLFGETSGGEMVTAHAMVTCSVARTGDRYAVRCGGGTPALPERQVFGNLLFGPGPQPETSFDSLARDGSVAGIHIGTAVKPNLNFGGGKETPGILFTGVR